MTRPQIVAYLNALEKSHDVNAMVLDGVCVWPLLRAKIGEDMLRKEEPIGRADVELKGTTIVRLWRVLRGLLLGAWSKRALPRVDLLFQSGNGQRVVMEGRHVDRFADPLIAAGKGLSLRSLVLERSRGVPLPTGRDKSTPRYDLTPQFEAAAALFWRKPMTRLDEVPGAPALFAQVIADGHDVGLDFLRNQLHCFRFYRRQHRALLERTRPRCVFLVSWYNAEHMALIHECHVLGIRTVDLQHGVQGPAHLTYGAWTKIPANGYSVMPDVFWCWDEYSTRNINSWAFGTPHTAIHLGDPFLEQAACLPMDPRWKKDGRKRVLYAIQPLNDVVPALVLTAIKATHNDAQWIIRTHPNWQHTIPAIEAILQGAGLKEEVLIDDGSITPLAALLTTADLHLTDFSSVVIEAEGLGIPSAAVHPHSADLFPEQLASGALTMTLTSEELTAWIRSPRSALQKNAPLSPLSERLRTVLGT